MLEVDSIDVTYGGAPAVLGVCISVNIGEVVSIVGSNGAGKSTILNTISGILRPSCGVITFEGSCIHSLPAYDIVKLGIAQVPEGRRIFGRLTVLENLILGGYTQRSRGQKSLGTQEVFDMFPILQQRQHQTAKTLSGGEQQMLAIARALMTKPKLLMLDEPSLGLSPKMVSYMFEIIKRIHQQGISILLVEQNIRASLKIADRAYVIQTGRIVLQGTGQDLLKADAVREAYLGM